MKRCWKCKKTKQLSEYYKNKSQPDGHTGLCKECKKEYHKGKGYDNWKYKTKCWKGREDYGIYKLINKTTGEYYIGRGWLYERKGDHLHKLKYNKHDNKWMQESYNKSTPKDWEFEILEKCSTPDSFEKERDYLIQAWLSDKNLLLNKKIELRFK